jgi:hypothetical protein
LELKLSHEQKLVAESRAAILEQQQIIYDLKYRIQGLAAFNEELEMALMSQKSEKSSQFPNLRIGQSPAAIGRPRRNIKGELDGVVICSAPVSAEGKAI